MDALINRIKSEIFQLGSDLTNLNEYEIERLQHILYSMLKLIEINYTFTNEIKHGVADNESTVVTIHPEAYF